MKQILPNLWQIDEIGTWVGCYLWQWEEGLTLIDTGKPGDARKILASLRKAGHAYHRVKRIIITHVDMDHVGGLAQIKFATGARVACHAVEREPMLRPNLRNFPQFYAQVPYSLFRRLPPFSIRPTEPDELLLDGEILPEGFTVVHTPGHTAGHIALLHKGQRFLIAGDALVNSYGNLRGPSRIFSNDRDNGTRSIWRLAKKHGDDFETILFGHGDPILQNGGKRVKSLASRLYETSI